MQTQTIKFWGVAWRILVFSFFLNVIWEFVHVYLYIVPTEKLYGFGYPWFLLLATIGDVVIILGIYFLIGLITRNIFWLFEITTTRFILLLIFGFLIAWFIEYRALAENKWLYTQNMPLVPLLNIGVSPVVQMLILPYLTIWLSKKTIKNKV